MGAEEWESNSLAKCRVEKVFWPSHLQTMLQDNDVVGI
jgi:hypothetical protein